jgi:ABC-type branched-subunit amino acid transport system substrate-binding protein
MRTRRLTRPFSLALLALALACNNILGLNDFEPLAARGTAGVDGVGASADHSTAAGAASCDSNAQCRELAAQTAGAAGGASDVSVCVKPEHRCVRLQSEDCDVVAGEPIDDTAILIGTLFSTKGAQAATNLPRQQSATLAIEEINRAGGVPGATGERPRPLVVVSCDESVNLLRAGNHLANELHVPAIIGPNTSQDTIELSNQVTTPAGTLIITPTAVASSIADLADDDFSWMMVPSDVQRAPLMIREVNDRETNIRTERGNAGVKLGIVFRNDALGIGTRTSLNDLVLNGKPLADPSNTGAKGYVTIDGYDPNAPDQSAIVQKYIAFAPDILVLAGTAEAVTKVLLPLEQGWTAPQRPSYILIDSEKVPELLNAASKDDDLRSRVRGTGVTPTADCAANFNAFSLDYLARYQQGVGPSGMGPSYDAAYSVAYALAATRDLPVSGANLAQGLRKLSGGSTRIDVGSVKLLAAFQLLSAGQNINGLGTFLPLEWNAKGAVVGGNIEVWCIGRSPGGPVYQSSGFTLDLKTQTYTGTYTACAPALN